MKNLLEDTSKQLLIFMFQNCIFFCDEDGLAFESSLALCLVSPINTWNIAVAGLWVSCITPSILCMPGFVTCSSEGGSKWKTFKYFWEVLIMDAELRIQTHSLFIKPFSQRIWWVLNDFTDHAIFFFCRKTAKFNFSHDWSPRPDWIITACLYLVLSHSHHLSFTKGLQLNTCITNKS